MQARPASGGGEPSPITARADWVGIVANRNSGIGRGLRLVERLVARVAATSGLSAEIAWTPEERAALVSRSAADPRCRCLVAVGGDGTVSALLNEQPSVPLTVFPAGTENLVAQHFGLGRDPEVLAGTIAAGRPVRVDVGQAAGRRFLLMVGFGFDGDVVTRHHQARVSRSGLIRPTHRIAYVWPILRSSFSYRFPPISVRIADPGAEEVLTGTTVFVFNVPRYALGLPFVPDGARRRRLARPDRLSQTRAIPGFVLPLEGLSRHPSRRSGRVSSPGQESGRDRGRSDTRPDRRRPGRLLASARRSVAAAECPDRSRRWTGS